MLANVAITFIREGREYAFRRWRCIPRVGDFVFLNDNKTHYRAVFPVEEVAWGEDDKSNSQTALVFIGEPAPSPETKP